MKNSLVKVLSAIVLLLLAACGQKSGEQTAQVKKPNIVFFFADDFGFHAISANGNTRVQTPHIDAIANEGVRFKQSYVTAPICCASRAGLLTGRYQQRFGSENHLIYPDRTAYIGNRGKDYADFLSGRGINPDSLVVQGISREEINVAQFLKKQGYKTAIIGKWHAGFYDGYRPHQRGFDYAWGWYGGSSLYYVDENDPEFVTYRNPEGKYDHYTGQYQWKRDSIATGIFINGELSDEREYQTYAIAREATGFIEKNKDEPFFLYVPFGAVHTPLQAPKKYYDQLSHIKDEQQRFVLAMLLAKDEAIGKIQQKLKDLGLYDNTIFVFSGDNGSVWHNEGYDGKAAEGTYYADNPDINLNYPLKGGKLTHYEGGIRTPLLISWKGKISPGTVYEYPVSTLDLFPTFANAANAALPEDRSYDGTNLLPYITGENPDKPHETLFWRNGGVKTVRHGDYKLLVNDADKTTYLYDLSNDVSEKNDLSAKYPEKVAELKTLFETWEKELPAQQRWNSPRIAKIYVEGKEVSFQP